MTNDAPVTPEMLTAGFAAQEKLNIGDYSGEVEFQEARLAAAYRAMCRAAPKHHPQKGLRHV